MPNKKAKRWTPGEFKGYVNYPLDAEQKATIKAEKFTLEQADSTLTRLLEGGYSVSLKWDTYNECFQANLNVIEADNPNFGYCLTGRGSTPMKALKQAIYVHYNLLDGVWAQFVKVSAADMDD